MPVAKTPVVTTSHDEEEAVVSAPKSTSSDKAQDILAMIRARQQKA